MSKKLTSGNTKNLVPFHGTLLDRQLLERSNTDRVWVEKANAVATVKLRLHDALVVETDSLVTRTVELAMKSVNTTF